MNEKAVAMTSPIPGVDPFIESQKWRDFHHAYIAELRSHILVALRPTTPSSPVTWRCRYTGYPKLVPTAIHHYG